MRTTEKRRRKAVGPRTSNTGASNASSREPSTRIDLTDGVGEQAVQGFRLLHADVDSLVVTSQFVMRWPVRRDFQRAQVLAARAAGQSVEDPVDAETNEPLNMRFEELRLLEDADLWEQTRTLDGEGSVQAVAFELGGIVWRCEGYGHGGYRWFLRSEYGDLWLNPEKTKMRPAAKVRMSPEFIAAEGALGAWERMYRVLGELALYRDSGTVIESKVQRIDLKVDFLGASWLGSASLLERLVSRATKSQWYALPYGASLPTPEDEGVVAESGKHEVRAFRIGKRETGWMLGSKDNIQVACYDKTFEVGNKQGSVATWQRAVWNAGGAVPLEALDASAPSNKHVWRIEVRFASAALRSFRIRKSAGSPRRPLETVTDVIQSIGDLWRYATEGWLRVVDRTATRLCRCPTNETWRALSEWPLGHGPAGQATFAHPPHLEVSRAQAGVAKAEQTTSAIMGAMSSLLAAVGPREALALCRKAMPDASALDAAAWFTSRVLMRHAKRKAVATVAERMYGDALKKEADLSVLAGMHPTTQLQEMIHRAARNVSEADAETVLFEKVAASRKERERRQKKALQVVFEGCDLNDPMIRAAYDKAIQEQKREDHELRSLVDTTIREFFDLEADADVTEFLLGNEGGA